MSDNQKENGASVKVAGAITAGIVTIITTVLTAQHAPWWISKLENISGDSGKPPNVEQTISSPQTPVTPIPPVVPTSPTPPLPQSLSPLPTNPPLLPFSNPNDSQEIYSLPFFMVRRVDETDLQGKSMWELDVMRNEIFARHGRRFQRADLQEHFNSQSWYTPKYLPDEFPNSSLTPIQKENAKFILEYQNRR